MLFMSNLFCFDPCSCPAASSQGDNDISNLEPDEAAAPKCENMKSLHRRNDDKDNRDKEETDSSSGRSRKGIPMKFERGFLKRVLGSNEKDRGLVRERDRTHKGQKTVSPPFAKEDIVRDRKPGSEGKATKEEDGGNEENRQSNQKQGVRENSILYSLEPPSFRIYCVHNVSVDNDNNEDIPSTSVEYQLIEAEEKDYHGDKEEENRSQQESEKESESQPVKGRRKGRFSTVLRRRGSPRMKNILLASCGCPNPSTSQDSFRESGGKAV